MLRSPASLQKREGRRRRPGAPGEGGCGPEEGPRAVVGPLSWTLGPGCLEGSPRLQLARSEGPLVPGMRPLIETSPDSGAEGTRWACISGAADCGLRSGGLVHSANIRQALFGKPETRNRSSWGHLSSAPGLLSPARLGEVASFSGRRPPSAFSPRTPFLPSAGVVRTQAPSSIAQLDGLSRGSSRTWIRQTFPIHCCLTPPAPVPGCIQEPRFRVQSFTTTRTVHKEHVKY